MNKITIEVSDLSKISDGYHTIEELYDHRSILFVALMNTYPDQSWHALKHDDGSFFPGWLIAGMDLNGKQISYHLPAKFHGLISEEVKFSDKAPKWDGHTSEDVLEVIEEWLR